MTYLPPHPTTPRDRELGTSLSLVPPRHRTANAGPRAAARARITPETNTEANRDANSPPSTERDSGTRLRRWITPPNPRETAPPTWDQLAWHGDHGRHAPRSGWPRTLSVLWSRTVAQPGRAAAIWLDWVSRSPSRCLVVFVLYALIAHLPGMGWLPWFF